MREQGGNMPTYKLSRRQLLLASGVGVGLAALPRAAWATPDEVQQKIIEQFGTGEVKAGRVNVTTPPISENGYSVPLTVEVESPMTDSDFVKRIAVFAEKNPFPNVANFELGPHAGRAKISTRIRMGDSQRIIAVAEMSDGALWSGYAFSIVTLAACIL